MSFVYFNIWQIKQTEPADGKERKGIDDIRERHETLGEKYKTHVPRCMA